MNRKYILKMENISKSFPGVKALDNVSFYVKFATVHALVGENGAGKSTLMNILMGIYPDYDGEIKYNDAKIKNKNVSEIMKMGISMIHQDLKYIPNMTVAENIFLGREPVKKLGFLNKKIIKNRTKELLENFDIDIDPTQPMKDLSVAEKQIIEIIKAISYNSNLIIMDEPTSAISNKEINRLFKFIKDLKNKGVSIIYISHKLNEIFEIADEITVLRNGEKIGTYSTRNISENDLIFYMLGDNLDNYFSDKKNSYISSVKMSIKNLTKHGVFRDITFYVRRGEVLGIAGLMGAKRTDVAKSIFGLENYDSGEIFIDNKKVNIKTPYDAMSYGIGLISEDRKELGLVLSLSVSNNIILPNTKLCSWGPFILKRKKKELVDYQIKNLAIKTTTSEQKVKNLSGGNQQKVVIAKVLLSQADILILDEPTKGIDIGAKSEIYKLISELASEGKSIIMISSEIMEILKVSDRVIVLHAGELTAELIASEITQENILKYAMGLGESY